jgi:hypothetical protein
MRLGAAFFRSNSAERLQPPVFEADDAVEAVSEGSTSGTVSPGRNTRSMPFSTRGSA